MKNTIKTFVAVALSAACLLDCSADWAENQFVRVSCEHPDVEVIAEGEDFYVLAPGKPETFYADVMVNAITGWQLLQPAQSQLPLRMCGGSSVRYKVAKPPESEKSGMIYFHNYIIRSNHDDGAKNIAVPAGANVIYTAYRDGDSRESYWNVDGEYKIGYSFILFDRNWWDVPSWFVGTMTTPRPDTYSIRGNDVDFITLDDTGEMKVIGIRQIALSGGVKSSDRIEPPGEGETWQETEVIYSEPCAVFDLTATLWPDTTTAEEYAKIKDNISWTFASGRIERDESNPLHATCHSPSQPGEYIVTASCGTASRIILVKVGISKIHKVAFAHNFNIRRDTNQSYYDHTCDWRDDNLDGISDMVDANAKSNLPYHPIAYLSTTVSAAEGWFRPFCTKVSDSTQLIDCFDVSAVVRRARSAWHDRSGLLIWGITQLTENKASTVSVRPFEISPKVRYDPSAELVWEIGYGETDTQENQLAWYRSSSRHELHLLFGSPKNVPYETVLYLSCLNASGCSSESDVIAGVWSGFASRDVKRKDGNTLTYYGSYLTTNVQLEELLSERDGQCGAWVYFLQAALDVQGICNVIYEVKPKSISGAEGFVVKTWSFEGSGSSGDQAFPYKNDIRADGFRRQSSYVWGAVNEVNYVSGCPGQNNSQPAAFFMLHYILKVAGTYYDPSYGVTYGDEADFVNNLSGFWKSAASGHAFFFRQNTPSIGVDFSPLQRSSGL